MKNETENIEQCQPAESGRLQNFVGRKIKPETCKECGEIYEEPELIKDFIGGICLPCRVEKEINELYAEWDRELELLNKRINTNYDFTAFCMACNDKLLNRNDLKGLKELKIVYNNEYGWKDIREYGDSEKDFEIQLGLFEEELPF